MNITDPKLTNEGFSNQSTKNLYLALTTSPYHTAILYDICNEKAGWKGSKTEDLKSYVEETLRQTYKSQGMLPDHLEKIINRYLLPIKWDEIIKHYLEHND